MTTYTIGSGDTVTLSNILTREVPLLIDAWHPPVSGMPTFHFTIRQYDSQWNELSRHPFSFLANSSVNRIILEPVSGASGITIGDSACAFVAVPEAGTVWAVVMIMFLVAALVVKHTISRKP